MNETASVTIPVVNPAQDAARQLDEARAELLACYNALGVTPVEDLPETIHPGCVSDSVHAMVTSLQQDLQRERAIFKAAQDQQQAAPLRLPARPTETEARDLVDSLPKEDLAHWYRLGQLLRELVNERWLMKR